MGGFKINNPNASSSCGCGESCMRPHMGMVSMTLTRFPARRWRLDHQRLSTNPCDRCLYHGLHEPGANVDVCEVIPVGSNVALVGFRPHKDQLVNHLSERILGQPITINDISKLNDVFLGRKDCPHPNSATVHESHFGTMYIVPVREDWQATWTMDDWNEHRIEHLLPFHGYEITNTVHPLACGLGDLVHPQKGCYVGQEVLTRMRSRGKFGRRLTRVPNPDDRATTVGKKESLVLERIQ